MPPFARVWRLLERKFPPSGPAIIQPSQVSNDVQLVHDLLSPGFNQAQTRLESFFNTDVTGVGGDLILNLTRIPPPGFIWFPVMATARYDGVANIAAEVRIARVAGAETDPWGDWLPTLAAGATQQVGHVRVSNNRSITLPTIPIPNNNQLEVRFVGTAAAANVFTASYGILIPGELAHLEMWRGQHPNFVWTVALP